MNFEFKANSYLGAFVKLRRGLSMPWDEEGAADASNSFKKEI